MAHQPFKVRPAVAADVEPVLPMVRAICALHESWDPARYALPAGGDIADRYRPWLHIRATDPRSLFLVAQSSDGPLIGFVVVTIEPEIPIYTLKEYAFVQDLWVDPAHRGTGVGKAIVRELIDRLGKLGVQQIRLDTAAANEPARRLFASCGFRVSTIAMLREL